MLAAAAFGSRPLAARPLLPRPFVVKVPAGEYGWAAWSYSRQAKLNAWSWHGLGAFGGANVNAWAVLGNTIYMRREADGFVHMMQPDAFLQPGEENTESAAVEATTQWLDFSKPGKLKALTGIDFDGAGVLAVEVYVSAGGDRDGVLAESVPVGDNQGGWTYSGETIPLSSAGTEFKLRFLCDPRGEAQVNRLSLHFDLLEG